MNLSTSTKLSGTLYAIITILFCIKMLRALAVSNSIRILSAIESLIQFKVSIRTVWIFIDCYNDYSSYGSLSAQTDTFEASYITVCIRHILLCNYVQLSSPWQMNNCWGLLLLTLCILLTMDASSVCVVNKVKPRSGLVSAIDSNSVVCCVQCKVWAKISPLLNVTSIRDFHVLSHLADHDWLLHLFTQL